MKNTQKSSSNSGYVLIALLTTVSFVVVAAISVASLASNNLRVANSDTHRLAAQFAADAGADASVQALNLDLDWEDSAGEQTVANTSTYRTTYESTLNDGPDDLHRILSVTGRTYVPASSSTPTVERSYDISLRGISAGSFSLVSGVGGLIMQNSAKVIGGAVHVNGSVTMSNSAQIGLSTSPVNVTVAHYNCPVSGGTSYPSQCPIGNDEPIKISNPAWIYGDVKTANSTDLSPTTISRMSNGGLVPGSVSSIELPSHDRQQLISDTNAATAADPSRSITGSAASCSGNGTTKTWKANTKITGDVSISQSCTVLVEGDVWITGDISLRNSGSLRVANGLTTAPVIMVDGSSGVSSSQSGSFISNNSSIGFRVITYHSAAACSPNCADVTGLDLFNSRNITTINIGQTSSGPNTEFYARWTEVEMGNSGGIGALAGQTVKLTNSAAVTFGVEVSGINTINGWVIESYKRNYD